MSSLSVFFSCRVSTLLNGMSEPHDMKDFLSKPSSAPKRREFEKLIKPRLKKVNQLGTAARAQLRNEIIMFMKENQYHTASMWACLTLQAPLTLLNLSLGAFLVGLGIYLASVFAQNLDVEAGRIGSRAVLICYVVCIGCSFGLFAVPRHLGGMESGSIRRWIRAVDQAPRLENERVGDD